MPNGTIVADDYIDDPNRTVSEVQAALNQNFDYLRSLQAEMAALSSTVLREASVRSIGNSTGNVPDKEVLDSRLGTTGDISSRLGTTGNLGSAATESYQTAMVVLGRDFGSQTVQVTRIGNVVTIAARSILTHFNTSVATSLSGILPVWAIPLNSIDNVFSFSKNDISPENSIIANFKYVNSQKYFQISYSNANLTDRLRDNSFSIPFMTYVV